MMYRVTHNWGVSQVLGCSRKEGKAWQGEEKEWKEEAEGVLTL
jgi:hypothetical protein